MADETPDVRTPATSTSAAAGTAERSPRSQRPTGAVLVGLAVATILGGIVGGALVKTTGGTSGNLDSMCRATAVAEKGLPSVVTISAKAGAGAGGTGSGEVIREGGYILTNDHVISVAGGPGGSVSVLYNDGTSSAATIVGRDPDTDLAVLKAADGAVGRPIIATGSSAGLRVGQPVVALGAPLGLSSTVTSGIVSALGRYLSVPGDNGVSAQLIGAIQTDAAINPGNSGGALVDCSTRLVGINTAIATVPNADGQPGGGSVGLGFAIPVDMAMPLADELIKNGRVNHPTFGLSAQLIPPSVAVQAGVSPGLYVRAVAAGGPAASAGLRAGDIITALDGVPATSNDALIVRAIGGKVGDVVKVTYERDGAASTVDVTLAAQQ